MEIKQKAAGQYYIISTDKQSQLGPFADWQEARNKYSDILAANKKLEDEYKQKVKDTFKGFLEPQPSTSKKTKKQL